MFAIGEKVTVFKGMPAEHEAVVTDTCKSFYIGGSDFFQVNGDYWVNESDLSK